MHCLLSTVPLLLARGQLTSTREAGALGRGYAEWCEQWRVWSLCDAQGHPLLVCLEEAGVNDAKPQAFKTPNPGKSQWQVFRNGTIREAAIREMWS
jgi:hypothetical protein